MKTLLLAIDSMVFIYHLESYQNYTKKTTRLFKAVHQGKLRAVTSVVSLIEVLSTPKLETSPQKVGLFSRFFYETPNLSTVDVTREISEQSAKLRRKYTKLRTPDSIQISTALNYKADFFVTNDLNLKKIKIPRLKIISVSDLSVYKGTSMARISVGIFKTRMDVVVDMDFQQARAKETVIVSAGVIDRITVTEKAGKTETKAADVVHDVVIGAIPKSKKRILGERVENVPGFEGAKVAYGGQDAAAAEVFDGGRIQALLVAADGTSFGDSYESARAAQIAVDTVVKQKTHYKTQFLSKINIKARYTNALNMAGLYSLLSFVCLKFSIQPNVFSIRNLTLYFSP